MKKSAAGFWGAVGGGALLTFIMVRYFSSTPGMIVGCVTATLESDDAGASLIREICSAYLDPSATFVRKFIFTGVAYLVPAAILGGIFAWLAGRFDWFYGDEVPQFWIGAGIGFLGLLLLFHGVDGDLIDYIASLRWIKGGS